MKQGINNLLVLGSLCAVLCAPCVAWAVGRQEISAAGLGFIPDDKHGLYNSGFGGEVQYRYWLNDDWGLALAAGALRLNVTETDSKINGSEGSVDIVPLGGSILYNFIDLDPFRLSIEGGVRYVITSSKASMVDVAGRRLDLEIDNGWVLLFGFDAEYALTSRLGLFGDAVYQYDPQGESVNTIYGPQRDNQFESVLLRLGVRANF